MLVKQYKDQFSNPRNNVTNQDINFYSDNDNDLTDINITDLDIQKAISEMNENSSAGPDDIPALFLIKGIIVRNLSKPFYLSFEILRS